MMSTTPKKRGPKKRHGPREEIHLKFSTEVMETIKRYSPDGYQAFFDALLAERSGGLGFEHETGKPMQSRLTPAQLEAMTTHEVADLLTNIVLLLRRLPNVPFSQLIKEEEEAKREHTEVG